MQSHIICRKKKSILACIFAQKTSCNKQNSCNKLQIKVLFTDTSKVFANGHEEVNHILHEKSKHKY